MTSEQPHLHLPITYTVCIRSELSFLQIDELLARYQINYDTAQYKGETLFMIFSAYRDMCKTVKLTQLNARPLENTRLIVFAGKAKTLNKCKKYCKLHNIYAMLNKAGDDLVIRVDANKEAIKRDLGDLLAVVDPKMFKIAVRHPYKFQSGEVEALGDQTRLQFGEISLFAWE